MKIHITGASGTGITTLAAKLAEKVGSPHFDSDNYFWLPTEIPFTRKRSIEERSSLLMADLLSSSSWILSGCKASWQDARTDSLYDLVVFLYVPHDVRLDRLKKREENRFGKQAIEPGGYFHDNHIEFMQWAESYDDNCFTGRSKRHHENWLNSLDCQILSLEGNCSIEENFQAVLHYINGKCDK